MTNTYQLTEKQERFCEHYSVHKQSSAAYRYAYATAGWNAQMVASEAWKVRQVPQVALRLLEMATDSRKAFTITVAEKKQWLKQIVDINMQTIVNEETGHVTALGDHNAAKGAINELNKMDGDHASIKTEVTGTVGTRVLTADEYKAARQEMLDSDDC